MENMGRLNKVLVTGGNGYIGQYIVDYLNKNDYDTLITSRNKEIDSRDKVLYMDLMVEESIIDICQGIDCVVHTATFDERKIKYNPKEALLVNGYGTKLLLDSAQKHGVRRFIYLSTFHVYGSNNGVITENSIVNPLSDYAITHHIGELYVNQYSRLSPIDAISLRITNGIGAPITDLDRWHLVLNDFCVSAYETGAININSAGEQERDFISIRDVSQAVEKCISYEGDLKNISDTFNISSQESVTIYKLALQVSEVYKKRYNKKISINRKLGASSKNKLLVKSELMRELGWRPIVDLKTEINNVFEYIEKSK